MIIVNFKNYKKGEDVLGLAKRIERHVLHAVVAVPAMSLERVAAKSALNVYAQHVDVTDERSTGLISAEGVRASGASGAILNHSEHPLKMDVIKKTIDQCKKAGLVTLVCASSLEEVKKIAAFRPEMIAFEDPKLIGTGKSITNTKAHAIEKFVSLLQGKPTVPICGAGLTSAKDVDAAYALGCKGILISSAIVASKNPEKLLKELSAWNF